MSEYKYENSNDEQSVSIDIDKIYASFIAEIDSIRSHVNINNLSDIDKVFDLDKNEIKLNINPKPQESRCHAFYRLIGLPVASKSRLYNPGFYLPYNGNEDIKESKKAIAKEIDKNLLNLMLEREIYIQDFKKIFSKKNIESSVLALTSSKKRKFFAPLEKNANDPFSVEKPSYKVELTDYFNKEYKLYSDESGSKIKEDSQALSSSRKHIIKPFIVDPRIDLTVSPSEKRIAVPFAEDKSKIQLSKDNYAKRPYIEFVCKNRLDGRNKLDKLTESQTKTINLIKNQESFKDISGIKKITEGVGNVSEQSQFVKFFNIMRAIISELISCERILDLARKQYYWVPIPDENGPELGMVTRDIIPNDSLNTEKDQDIANKKIKKNLDDLLIEVLSQTEKDLGGFAFDSIQITPDSNPAIKDNNSENLDNELNKRNEYCNNANRALKKIEIIMGEFSGLGFCDIIAIYAALWLIDKDKLIGLLDNNSFERMKKNTFLNSKEVNDRANGNSVSAIDALKAFEDKVKEMYQLMDKIYDDIKKKV